MISTLTSTSKIIVSRKEKFTIFNGCSLTAIIIREFKKDYCIFFIFTFHLQCNICIYLRLDYCIQDGVEYSKPNSCSYTWTGKKDEKKLPGDKSRKSKSKKSFPFVCQKNSVWLVFNVNRDFLCHRFQYKAEFLSAFELKSLKISIHQQQETRKWHFLSIFYPKSTKYKNGTYFSRLYWNNTNWMAFLPVLQICKELKIIFLIIFLSIAWCHKSFTRSVQIVVALEGVIYVMMFNQCILEKNWKNMTWMNTFQATPTGFFSDFIIIFSYRINYVSTS